MVMKAKPMEISLRELVAGYHDDGDNGVVALGGKLNVRPPYQRAFVYEPTDRDRVIQSVYNNLPLNIMYWAQNPDGTFEIIDGQQRTISVCQFITNDDGHGNPIAINFDGKRTQTFDGLSDEKKQEILDNYKLQVFVCVGTDDEKLDWFHTINIAGKIMTEQELLNADYTGPWLTSAKSYFSKRENNPAIKNENAFYDNTDKHTLLNQTPETANRQELLELVLGWIIDSDPQQYPQIKDYMAKHRFDKNANELIEYYNSVIKWVKKTFTVYRKDMKGINWGLLYNKYKDKKLDTTFIEVQLAYLYDIYAKDPDGLKKTGFYEYALCGDRSLIWHRIFSEKQQAQAYIKQNRKCAKCGKEFPLEKLEAHHIKAYEDLGETIVSNCAMLCSECHKGITAEQNHKHKFFVI